MAADTTPDSPAGIPAGLPGMPGGMGRRLAALAIDWFASLLIAIVAFPQFAYGSTESTMATMLVFALEVIVFTWLIAGSFGQRIMGLVVVRMDGGRLAIWRVAIRTVLLCLVIPAVVYDQYGRGLHDRAAGSICIRTRRPAGQVR